MPQEALLPTFKCRFQDLPAIAAFVRASLTRDRAALAEKSVKYETDDFLTGYDTGLAAVNDLVNPATFTAQHKKLTEQIETDALSVRPLLNNLDIRLDDAADLATDAPTGPQLTISPADFGISALRTAITNGDAEGIIAHGKTLLHNLTTNAAALAAVKYPAAERAQLEALLDRLAAANTEQSKLLSARDANVQANLKVLNDFYDKYLSRALRDGKKAFKETDKAKTDDYTFAKLKAQVAPPQKAKSTPPA